MTPEFNQETERNDIFIDEEPKFQHMEIEISSPEKKIDLSSSDADSAKINLSRQIIEPKNMGFNKKKNKKISNLYLDEDETKKNDNQIIIGNTMGMTMIETEQKTVNDILFEEKETFILNKKTLLQVTIEVNILIVILFFRFLWAKLILHPISSIQNFWFMNRKSFWRKISLVCRRRTFYRMGSLMSILFIIFTRYI